MSQTPDLLDCLDHRDYLARVLSRRRESGLGLSLRTLSKKAGFKTPATLSMIVSGKRGFTRASAEKLSTALSLTGVRRKLLVAYSALDSAETEDGKARAREQILRLRSHKPECLLDLTQFSVLSSWVALAIYTAAGMRGFRADSAALAKRLGRGVTPAQVGHAIENLLALKLLQRAPDGQVRQSAIGAVSTPDEIRTAAAYQYHQKMTELAREALALPSEMREFNGLTVPVTDGQLPIVKEKIRKFRKELNEYLSQGDDDGEVYQLNLQFFPLTGATERPKRRSALKSEEN